MTIAEIKKTAETKMGKSIEAFKHELQKVRTGRAHPGLLDQVHVDYYGAMVPISQVANVTLLDARTISVQPWEKGLGAKIEKAIRESDLGLNPAAQGDLLRVPIDVSLDRLMARRVKLKFYEAGMDLGWSPNPIESFRLFQGKVLDEYDRLVEEFGLEVIDATLSITEQQRVVRALIAQQLEMKTMTPEAIDDEPV